MKNDFEEIDQWLMEITKNQRDQKVPEKELESFREEVVQKIMTPQVSGLGAPYAMLGFAAGGTFLIVMASIIFILHAHITKPAPEEKPPVEKKEAVTVAMPAPLDHESAAKHQSENSDQKMPASQGTFTESEIIAEIEALRELGAWDEKDEQDAGIPVEVSFADVQSYLENQQTVAPTSVA